MPRIRAENVNAHKALSRETILNAAEKAFSKHGFLSSNLSDIADVAGLGRSTIYEYFSSKEDLLLGVAEARLVPIMQLVTAVEESQNPMDDICLLCRMTIDFMADNLELTKVVTWESRFLPNEYQQKMWELVEPLSEQFQKMIRAGLPDENPEILARVILFAIRDAGDILLHAEEEGFAFDEVKRTTISFIRKGLGLPSPDEPLAG